MSTCPVGVGVLALKCSGRHLEAMHIAFFDLPKFQDLLAAKASGAFQETFLIYKSLGVQSV